jgi:hypothetical protein
MFCNIFGEKVLGAWALLNAGNGRKVLAASDEERDMRVATT